MSLKATWVDGKRAPRCAPDPNFPNGIDIDMSEGAAKTCSIDLPYPAKRCGFYVIRCDVCGFSGGATTAGRPDDPRKLTLACYSHKMPDLRNMKRTPHA